MGKHESSVNFGNLIKDLADMYPFDTGIVVLVELLANALDSKATLIDIDYDPKSKVLVVADNGKGMTEAEFGQYHDFAAGLKTRGTGIGFAGVGAKISFNIASRVITETRSKTYSGGSNWYLESGNKLVWEDIKQSHLDNTGTRVEVIFRKDVSLPFKDKNSIVNLIKQNYLPLIDNNFLSLYETLGFYNINLRFRVNGDILNPIDIVADFELGKVRHFFPVVGNKKIGFGIFGLSSREYSLGENMCGILLCTYGKVVKADLFNQFPSEVGPRLFGVVEIPEFINFLTSSKTDFMRGRKYKDFEKYYDPIRQEFKNWLKEVGIQTSEFSSGDEAQKIERELKKLLDDIPELGEFFGFRARHRVLQTHEDGKIASSIQEGAEATFPIGNGSSQGNTAISGAGDGPGDSIIENPESNDRAQPISRTARHGPKIGFIDSPERLDMAWVDGNNIIINSGHPAYIKVRSNVLASRLHCIHAIADAVQKFIYTGSEEDLNFPSKMMAAWGRR
jgi:hypothetical protein